MAEPAVCQLAVDLQFALNAGDVDFVTGRLQAEHRPCRDVIHALDEDVGCASMENTSDPLVFWLVTQGDCCSTSPARFAESLERFLDDASSTPGRWRISGIVTGNQLWREHPSVLLMRGTAPDAPMVDVGTFITEGVSIPGAVHGTRGTYLIFPDAVLVPWP